MPPRIRRSVLASNRPTTARSSREQARSNRSFAARPAVLRVDLPSIDLKPDPWHRRIAIVQVLSVIILAIGLYLTYQANGQMNAANREQQHHTALGQITDRIATAKQQLGQPGPEKIDLRLGAIYSLEWIMRDSAAHQPAVVDVLSAFVRVHAPAPTAIQHGGGSSGSAVRPLVPSAYIQAVLTVLARRTVTEYSRRVDLRGTDLRGANLHSARLAGADLTGADLTGADLESADLKNATLRGGVLTGARLNRAVLTGADLERVTLIDAQLGLADLSKAALNDADLSGAYLALATLRGTNLIKAGLVGTDLSLADLSFANLTSADLAGANLPGTIVTGANLTCMRTDSRTRMPDGARRPGRC